MFHFSLSGGNRESYSIMQLSSSQGNKRQTAEW